MKVIKLLHLFSIDISFGAVAGSFFTSYILGIRLPVSYYLILFLSVMVIYSTDHLIDGIRKKGRTSSEIHRFFYNYRIPIGIITLFLVVFIFRFAFYVLESSIIEYGFIIGGFIVVYFLLNTYYQQVDRVLFVKELWISLIYVFAVVGIPIVFFGSKPVPGKILLFVSFGFLVFSNVLSYSYFEYNKDISDGDKSLATVFGKNNCRIIVFISLALALLSLISGYIMLRKTMIYPVIVLFLMSLIHACIYLFEKFFRDSATYGLMADFAFLIPYLLLLKGIA